MSHRFPDRPFAGEAGREEWAAALRAALLDPEAPHGAPLPSLDELAPQPPADAYADALEGALAAATAVAETADAEERRAAADHERIAALPPAERLAAVESDPRYHTWAFVEKLCEASFSAGFDQPQRGVELAELAVAASEATRRGAVRDDPALDADLAALAWAQLANAQRVASDLHAAGRALATARLRLAAGTGDPLPRARLLSFEASLAAAHSRHDESILLAERAARLYRRLGDAHGYGRTRLKQATFHAYVDDLETACDLLADALLHVDPESEPRVAFAAHVNRASYLDQLGRHDEVSEELAAAEQLATAPLDRVRWEWLAGRLAGHRGESKRAEEMLLAARDAFLERGVAYEFALVSLDLAMLFAEQGRAADMKRLAEEMLPIFTSREVAPAAQAALKVYYDAALAETAGQGLVREVTARVRRSRQG